MKQIFFFNKNEGVPFLPEAWSADSWVAWVVTNQSGASPVTAKVKARDKEVQYHKKRGKNMWSSPVLLEPLIMKPLITALAAQKTNSRHLQRSLRQQRVQTTIVCIIY